ncbi:hypothetical protein BT96DRAFT_624547 [Gymnopus androsaceus JB14]|uniref:Uncharacterized protein n=1 Tax=Gymnopus androsaceus JB14 TaxID=1447944 RepID=A0A6A4IIL5_9AGAR|nr:hypothetical protein BT96DRAFT_624547 [Gymnopus androsaceus JB14]
MTHHSRADLERQCQSHKTDQSLLSPFLEIPNEIVYVIFELACADNFLQDYPWPLSSEPPIKLTLPVIAYLPTLAISAVCTRWRSLALASPILWSQIRVESASRKDKVSDTQSGFISTLKLYLKRSVDTPLSIGLRTQGRVYVHGASPPLNLLLQHTCRWKSFSYFGDNELKKCIGSSLSFPILQNLTVHGPHSVITSENLDSFANAPNLDSVATSAILKAVEESSVNWQQVTSMDIWVAEGEDLDVLHRFPALTILKLRSSWSRFEPSTPLAKLHSLTFIDWTDSDDRDNKLLENMFIAFTIPALAELVIYPDNNGSISSLMWASDAFHGFISRSSCTLTTLSLSSVAISDSDLISALRILPSLTSFSIKGLENLDGGSPITSHFMSSMHSSSAIPLLPRLRCLSIISHDTSFDDTAFVSMVSSRWISDRSLGIDCLRSLVLRFSDRWVEEEVYKPLWDLDRMGMRVIITDIDYKGQFEDVLWSSRNGLDRT